MNATIRFYGQTGIFDNYLPHISKLLTKHSTFLEILSPIKLDGHTKLETNDFSILLIRETEVHKQSQSAWFMRTTKDVRDHSNKKILIIVFSCLDSKILEQRRLTYQSEIPHSTIVYLDFEDWFPIDTEDYFNRHFKDLKKLDDVIVEFIASIMSELYMY
jgi:hypothetical protein